MGIIGKTWTKLHYGLAVQWALDWLKGAGMRIEPYYLILESSDFSSQEAFPAGYTAGFLSAEDMLKIDCIDGRTESAAELCQRLQEGKLCFALKKGSDIAVFGWADLYACNAEECRFPLAADEAYLFDLHTVKAFRGKDLAPGLRRKLYQELRQFGKMRFYSITECFNRPSLRFKQKLGARIIRTGLYLKLFNLPPLELTLRKAAFSGLEEGKPVASIP